MPSSPPIALTRAVSPSIDRCELIHLAREPIDAGRAQRQHEAYERALEACGCTVHRLPVAPELPDAVFVEDAAVVVDEVAVMTRPGAASRRGEVESVAEALIRWRSLAWIRPPATLDGGDVLRVGRSVWVGLSSRTGLEGLDQLNRVLEPHGYSVRGVRVSGCLHLKTAVTDLSDGLLLVNPAWVDPAELGLDVVEVDPNEPYAANALRIGARVVYPEAFQRTAARIEGRGVELVRVDVSELAKAEGGVTCCSILVR
mgnify:CR=1 FL=1